MIADTKLSNERILKNALDIIYLVTGDEYVIVKKKFQCKCIDLLTSEIPLKHKDIASFFSLEEWEYIKGYKNLSQDDTIGNHRSISPPGNDIDILKGLPISFLRKIRAQEEDGTNGRDSELGRSPSVSVKQVEEEASCRAEMAPTEVVEQGTAAAEEDTLEDANKLVFGDSETQKVGGHCLPEDCSPLKHILEKSHRDISSSGQVEEDDAAKYHGHKGDSDTLAWLSGWSSESYTKDIRFVLSPLWSKERNFPLTSPSRELHGVPHPASSSSDQTMDHEVCRYSAFDRDSNSSTHSLGQTVEEDDQSIDMLKRDLDSCLWDTKVEYDTDVYHEFQGKSNKTACLAGQSTENCISSSHEPQDDYEETTPEGPPPSPTSTFNQSPPKTSLPGHTFSNDCQDDDIEKVKIEDHSILEKPFQHVPISTDQHGGPKRKRSFACDECGERFTYKYLLIGHQRIHTGEKSLKCDECGKDFLYYNKLQRHQRSHKTGTGPRCDVCGKQFIYQSSLIRHKLTRPCEKPVTCEECGKELASNFNLVAHQRTHTGEKPYKCKFCGKCFAHKSPYNEHMKSHARVSSRIYKKMHK